MSPSVTVGFPLALADFERALMPESSGPSGCSWRRWSCKSPKAVGDAPRDSTDSETVNDVRSAVRTSSMDVGQPVAKPIAWLDRSSLPSTPEDCESVCISTAVVAAVVVVAAVGGGGPLSGDESSSITTSLMGVGLTGDAIVSKLWSAIDSRAPFPSSTTAAFAAGSSVNHFSAAR